MTGERRTAWRYLTGLGLVALTGCAALPPPATYESQSISGRLSVRVDASGADAERTVSGTFELQGAPQAGQLDLSTPLGTMMARARWTSRQAWLTTPQRETAYPDLDSLTRDLLGESLPVAALFDWLRGRPWSGASSQSTPAGFQQLGWNVDLGRFKEGSIAAERPQAPRVTVKARIDPP